MKRALCHAGQEGALKKQKAAQVKASSAFLIEPKKIFQAVFGNGKKARISEKTREKNMDNDTSNNHCRLSKGGGGA